MSREADVIIIGAGVVGLAIAAEIAGNQRRVFVFEKNRTFGLETSSHNSEVIHAGLYYPENSLKAQLCVEGNRRLYDFCEKYGVNHRRLGKIIVAADDKETIEIERLYKQGLLNGAANLKLLDKNDIKKMEPKVKAVAGLFSPSTGILYSYGLMKAYFGIAQEQGIGFVFNTEVIGIEKKSGGYEVTIKDREGISSITTGIVVNSAGLKCEEIAKLAGIDTDKAGYKIYYCKGEYFSLNGSVGRLVNRLVYPVPQQAGVGVHITLSLDGVLRLGPSVKYVDSVDYAVDESSKADFYQAAHRYLPGIKMDDLVPDFAGIRPKLQGPNEKFRDFVIKEESDRGLPGLINLLGIESPGLTAAPAIAGKVAGMVREKLI